jgi:hypothetical protein
MQAAGIATVRDRPAGAGRSAEGSLLPAALRAVSNEAMALMLLDHRNQSGA